MRLFDILPNNPFTTSETMRDYYYYYCWYIRASSRVAERLILGNQEILGRCLNRIELYTRNQPPPPPPPNAKPNTTKNPEKNKNYHHPIPTAHHPTRKPQPARYPPRMTAGRKPHPRHDSRKARSIQNF